jgi:predicted DNA-binding transcriptional regulator YafY
LSSRQREFHHALTPDHNFKADEYAKAVGVSVRQARRDLMELEEFGLLVRTGKGPATRYRLVSGGGA